MTLTPALSSTVVHSNGVSMPDVLAQSVLLASLREFEEIKQEALVLCGNLSDVAFNRGPAPKRWSAAQCIEHLNLCGYEMALPAMDRLIAGTKERGLPSRSDYRNGRVGEWFVRNSDSSSGRRFKTFKRFETAAFLEVDETVDRFLRLQDLFMERLLQADELDLGSLKARNAVMVPLNLGQWFRFTAAHERRHLRQGRKAVEEFQDYEW